MRGWTSKMALIGKREDLVHVPWSSVEEWLEVYKQIYSGDLNEQNRAYETLLVWKTRIPKLPVGVECTLGLIQVCLRDREWTPKIQSGELPVTYENDLRMMHSTVIMKFLNHISNIAHHKQTSLFVIAKQLSIPDWIVDLRHDIAHGHELPSIDVMRVVANILLTWLHEEYWAAEAKNLQESQDLMELQCLNYDDEETMFDLIELWTAIGLYLKTNHTVVSDLPDTEIRDTLNNLFSKLKVTFTITDETELATIFTVLLAEISKNLRRGDSLLRREKLVIDAILNNEAFLTSSEILAIFIEDESSEKYKNCLPQSLIEFWKDFILFLQEKKLLLSLFLQLIELINKEKDANKKLLASLWVKVIAQAFNKQKITRHIYQKLEQKFDHEKQKLSSKAFLKSVQDEVEKLYPELNNTLTLNFNGDFPNCLMEETFVKRLILNFNEYSEHFIPEILKLSAFLDSDSVAKEKLLQLMKVHSLSEKDEEMETEIVEETNKVYTIEDIKEMEKNKRKTLPKNVGNKKDFADCKIRNTNWKLASDEFDWSVCPIGLLPWQLNKVQPKDFLTISPSDIRYAIVKNVELPKIVDSNKLKQHSKIQWESLLKKQKRGKRKPKLNESLSKKEQKVIEASEVAKQSTSEQTVES